MMLMASFGCGALVGLCSVRLIRLRDSSHYEGFVEVCSEVRLRLQEILGYLVNIHCPLTTPRKMALSVEYMVWEFVAKDAQMNQICDHCLSCS
jgi:hypothetical protein